MELVYVDDNIKLEKQIHCAVVQFIDNQNDEKSVVIADLDANQIAHVNKTPKNSSSDNASSTLFCSPLIRWRFSCFL